MPEFVNPFSGVVPGRKLTSRELARALRLALAAEEEATHLYNAIADATDDPLAKAVLEDIADEERVHVGELQRVLNILLPDEANYLAQGAAEVNDMTAKIKAPSAPESAPPSVGSLKS
jgi:rubrerythrin